MQQVTFDLPDEVASQLRPFGDQLPQILKLGLREFQAIDQEGFSGITEVLEFLAGLPTAEEIIALRPSESLQAQITTHEIDHIIAEKHGGITESENLALSCAACNKHKGSDLASIQ